MSSVTMTLAHDPEDSVGHISSCEVLRYIHAGDLEVVKLFFDHNRCLRFNT